MSASYTIHATKKLLDRVKRPAADPVTEPATALGNWYGTAWFWKPQLALLVNERTLLPVVMPLAPAHTLGNRFPAALASVPAALEVDRRFIEHETAAMTSPVYAKTASRSMVGMTNEFGHLAAAHRASGRPVDPIPLSLWLAHTPYGPLYDRHTLPDRELHALVAELGFGSNP